MMVTRTIFTEMLQTNISEGQLLSNLQIEALNEMQIVSRKTIDENTDTILLSSTGSGKTIAYLLPLVNLLNHALKKVQALVLVPSRELAIQIVMQIIIELSY